MNEDQVNRVATAAAVAAGSEGDHASHPVFQAVVDEIRAVLAEIAGYVHQEYPKWVDGTLVTEPPGAPVEKAPQAAPETGAEAEAGTQAAPEAQDASTSI